MPYSLDRGASMVGSIAIKLGVLGKWTIARNVTQELAGPNIVGSNPARFKLLRCGYHKILFH